MIREEELPLWEERTDRGWLTKEKSCSLICLPESQKGMKNSLGVTREEQLPHWEEWTDRGWLKK